MSLHSTSDSQYPVTPISSPSSPPSEVDSLPDSAPSDDLDDDDETVEGETSDAEKQWQESLQQMELLLTMVLVPYVGKYFGRKFAYSIWARFMTWKHPHIDVVVTSKKTFRAAGAVEAAATL